MSNVEPHTWEFFEHDDNLERWLSELTSWAEQAYLLADPNLSRSFGDRIAKGEKNTIRKYGTIYVPSSVIIKNLKEMERESRADQGN